MILSRFIGNTVLIFFQIAMLSGCAVGPAPYLPHDWISQSHELIAGHNQTIRARLQVFITYSGLETSHSALRLVTTNGPVIFWDPGGDYGRFDDDWNAEHGLFPEGTHRDNDLVLSNPPTIETFAQWRWTLHDTSLEVFEWDLADIQAQRLRQVLLYGTDDSHPAGRFSTWTYPMFCTMATSDFLKRFASPIIQLSQQYFFPDTLAQALYTQSPSRVHVYIRDGRKTVYSSPKPTAARQ
ncbi:MAG: hypothetical protein NPIRA05_09680 [Nitrospirales bacterium]|nr:MAG: hypothetical protein NPIRA05_09680 [Nitrospirales bacterium]